MSFHTTALYALQEAVLSSLQQMGDPQFQKAKLCGGTALSRCWLEHRVSYDLDFFFSEPFDAGRLAKALKAAGIVYEIKDLVDDPRKANQLHGNILHKGQRLKVSFVEDRYFDDYPMEVHSFGALTVQTEGVPGLYHRKLRCVGGSGDGQGDTVVGGRQKARDVFDLYVLAHHTPIQKFITELPFPFPVDAFHNGLVSMPWFELMDELQEIDCDPQWTPGKDVDHLQNFLYAQIGAKPTGGGNDGIGEGP